MTHFGVSEDVAVQLDELATRLDEWSALARAGDRERSSPPCESRSRHAAGAELAQTYQQAAPVEQLYAGYERYWSKRS